MATYTPKIVYINGTVQPIMQNTLKVNAGHGTLMKRVQVSGANAETVTILDPETQVAEISFDIMTLDSDSADDPRVKIANWKAAGGGNIITIEPDGVGQTQVFKNVSLENDPQIDESPNGVISLTWKSSPQILTN